MIIILCGLSVQCMLKPTKSQAAECLAALPSGWGSVAKIDRSTFLALFFGVFEAFRKPSEVV